MTGYLITLGTQWIDRNRRLCIVKHILTTTDENGEVREVRYESVHVLLGQLIDSVDCATTIARGMDRLRKLG